MNHEISPYRRVREFVVLLAVACLGMALHGCSGGAEPEVHADSAGASRSANWQFDSPDQFVAFASNLDDELQRIEIFEHMYGKTTEELWVVRYHRAAAQAELDYRNAVAEQFGDEALAALGPPQNLQPMPATPADARIEEHGETRVLIHFKDTSGIDDVIVLARIRGNWTPHATTITDGNDVTVTWCNIQQLYYVANIKYYADVATQIREGAYEKSDEAHQAVAQLLAGPPPPRGSIQID